MDPFDDTALCYFAALICGIRIINEKEAERGLPLGAIALDTDALVDFVRTKGDQLVHHMSTENERVRTAHMRWLPDELKLVVEESRRLCNNDPTQLRAPQLLKAQEILPVERRKEKFASNVVTYMRNALRTGDGRRSAGAAKPKRSAPAHSDETLRALAGKPNGHSSPKVVPILPNISVVELLADKIIESANEITAQALALAAERLKK